MEAQVLRTNYDQKNKSVSSILKVGDKVFNITTYKGYSSALLLDSNPIETGFLSFTSTNVNWVPRVLNSVSRATEKALRAEHQSALEIIMVKIFQKLDPK